jgi:hypothetical protein
MKVLPRSLILLLMASCIAEAGVTSLVNLPMCGKEGTTFYVSTNGNDTDPGSEALPFASLARACEAARKVTPSQTRTIVVRGGKYYDVSLALDARDSGLIIKAAPGETPILYGGKQAMNWEKDGDHFYAAKLPAMEDRPWDFRSLLVSGELRPRARLPQTGKFTHLTTFAARWHSTAGGGFHGADKPELKLSLQYRPGDLGPWLDVKNAELSIYHQWDDSVVGLKAHDPENQILYFSNPSGYPPGAFGVRTFVVWNVREGMSEPGQWYLDRSRNMVVYWPFKGEDIAKIDVVTPTTESIITIMGTATAPVTGITLDGFQLSATTTPLVSGGFAAAKFKGAIETEHTRNCTFNNLRISSVGGQAIRMMDGTSNSVTASRISNVGAGGIYDTGGIQNRICNNQINGFGRIYNSAIGISVCKGSRDGDACHDNTVTGNEISDGYYVGIQFGGSHNHYENNIVTSVMKGFGDGGAFYGDGKENVIRGNVIKDIRAHGYYIDELGEGIMVENNLSINCRSALHLHMASNNTIRNNIFDSTNDIVLSFQKCSGTVMEKNILMAQNKIDWWEKPNPDVVWKNNLFFSKSGNVGIIPKSSQQGDPGFVDPDRMNYSFKADSPATALGIKPLDFSTFCAGCRGGR